eukprot:COSAG01_NODE_12841_length_1677_cov_4.889734_2_plen_87_part_00
MADSAGARRAAEEKRREEEEAAQAAAEPATRGELALCDTLVLMCHRALLGYFSKHRAPGGDAATPHAHPAPKGIRGTGRAQSAHYM